MHFFQNLELCVCHLGNQGYRSGHNQIAIHSSYLSYKNILLHTYFCAYINTHAIFCLFSSNKKWIYVLHFQLANKLADHRALEIGEIVKYNELLYKCERRHKMASFGTSSKQSKACRQKGFCCLLSTYLSSYCISILYCIALTVEHNF